MKNLFLQIKNTEKTKPVQEVNQQGKSQGRR